MRATRLSWPKHSSSEVADDRSAYEILDQPAFHKILYTEQKRTERSRRRFVLMLLECTELLTGGNRQETLGQILTALSQSTRETDTTGWYRQGTVIGTVFTEIGPEDGRAVTKALLSKVCGVLSSVLSIEEVHQVHVSFSVFPEDWSSEGNNGSGGKVLYPETAAGNGTRKPALHLKRMMDIGGSLLALTLLAPVFAAIGLAIKLTSRGPILFRQQRVGQYGQRFTFLKFRSMYVANRQEIHQEFVKQFIRGDREAGTNTSKPCRVYKLTNDPRVTPIGRFLRRTSLDELPQFINVLWGEMSLVGPRPPVPYEVDCYDIWHKRRLIPVKPGITGLWQVTGRSRVGFDDMIRLDLQYAKSWSLWLDLKILLQTPLAVIGGEGAY